MHGHQVAPGWYVLNAWAPSGPWMLRLECMGTKWPPGCYVLNAWAPSGPWLLRLECMGTKWPLVGTS